MDNEKMVESVIQAQGSDVNAFAELFLGYKDAAYYVAKKMFSDENKALNIVYETCILVFRQIKTLNPASAFALWVNMIAGSVCKRRLTPEEQEHLQPGSADVALMGVNEDANAQISREAFDNAETRSAICSIVDALPTDQKLCALLYYFCGLKVEYIAQALGSTPLAIKNRLFSATNKIKEGMYGFENRGEKLYAVPAWLIASSLITQARTMQMGPQATQQVFAAGAQLVSGKAIVPPVLAAYVQARTEAAQPEPESEQSAAESDKSKPPVYESVVLEPENKFEKNGSLEEDAPDSGREARKPAKKKKSGGVTALVVVLVILVLAAAAVFILPRATDGRIDPLSMVLSLFSDPEEQLSKADTMIAEGDYAGAAEILKKLTDKDSSNAEYYLRLINVYEQLGQTDNAVAAYKNYFALVPRQQNLSLMKRYIELAPNEPVAWVDSAFGQLVCEALGKNAVTPADLQNVTELYLLGDVKIYTDTPSRDNDVASSVIYDTDAVGRNISFIYNGAEQGLAHYSALVDLLNFTNLRSLNLEFVDCSGLETVLPLKNDLTELCFLSCQLGAVPDLNMLGSLSALTIRHDSLTDISPISTLSGLTAVDLSYNNITSVSPLTTLTGIQTLNLFSNAVEDISPLSSLTALTQLNIGRNRIDDFDPLDDFDFEDGMYNDDNQFWEPEEVVE